MTQEIRVLVVDDDGLARNGIATYLRTVAEFKVTETESGQEALSILAKDSAYTAILLDYTLEPPITSEIFLSEIHNKYSQLPVIVVTGKDTPGGLSTLDKGAYRFIRRPLDPLEVTGIIRAVAEQDKVSYALLRNIKSMLKADVCLAWQLDRKQNHFSIAAWESHKPVDEEFRHTARLEMTNLKGFIKSGKLRIFANIQKQHVAPHYKYREEAINFGWKTMVSIPLVHNNHIVGIIDNYFYNETQFTEGENFTRAALQAWANQAAKAVQNANLANRIQKLQAISTLLAGTHDEESVLRQIIATAVEIVGADAGWLYLRDFDKNNLKRMTWTGVDDSLVSEKRLLGEGITGWVAHHGIARLAADVTKDDSHKLVPGLQIGSEIAVPLRREELTIGVLTVLSSHKNVFINNDVEILMALAAHAAVAITQTKLTKHLQEVTQRALTGDYNQLTTYVVRAIQDLTGADVSLFRVHDKTKDYRSVLSLVALQGDFPPSYRNKQIEIPVDPDESIGGKALATGQAFMRKNLLDEKEEPKAFLVSDARDHEWKGFLAIPLLGREGEKLGTLSLYSKEEGKFTKTDIDLLQPFVNQVAIALQQQKRSEALQLLAKIGETVTGNFADDPRKLMNQIAESACELLDAHCATIYPYDPARHQFYEQNFIGTARLSADVHLVTNKPRISGLAAKVRRTREIIVNRIDEKSILFHSQTDTYDRELLSEIQQEIRVARFIEREQIKAFVAISLIAGEENIRRSPNEEQEVGVLYINFRTPHDFTNEELQLIRIFAHQVANVVRSTRLYLEARRRADELNAINQTILRILDKADVLNVLDTLVAEATKLLGTSGGTLYLKSKEKDQLDLVAVKDVKSSVLKKGYNLSLGKGLAGKVFQSKAPLTVDDYVHWQDRIPEVESTFKSIVGVPLLLDEEAIGVIAVADNIEKRTFVQADIDILTRFASQAALAIHNARLHEDAQRRIRDLQIVNRIAEIISNKLRTQDILSEVVKQLHQLLGCADVTIFLAERKKKQIVLFPKATFGEIPDVIMEYRFTSKKGIAGRVFRQGSIEIINDVHTDADFVTERESRPKDRSMLAAAIKIGEQKVGVLCADHNKLDGFSESDKQLVAAVARHIGIAIERANGLEQLQTISSQIIAATQVDIMLEQIASGAVILANASSCGIYLVNDDHTQIVSHVQFPKTTAHPFPRFADKVGLTYEVVTTGNEIIIENASKDSRVHPSLKHRRFATITLPIKDQEKTIGAIHINATQKRSFTEIERSLLRTLASQATTAIQKAQLFEQEQRLRLQSETLYKISTIINENLQIQSILPLVIKGAVDLTKTDSGIIHLIDKENLKIKLSYDYPSDSNQPPSRFVEKRGYAWQIYIDGKIREIEDVQNDKAVSNDLKFLGIQTMLGVPLRQADSIIGILFLNSKEKRQFSSDEKSSLSLLAEQAALAIGRAQLFEQIQRQQASQINTISEITKSISATATKQQTLDSVIGWIVALFGEDCIGDVRLFDKKHKGFVVRSNIGKAKDVIQRVISIGKGITGSVASQQRTEVIPDVVKDLRYLGNIKDGVHSRIAVPMIRDHEVIGVLNIDNPRIDYFSVEDTKLAEAVAGLVAVALKNAELYEQLTQKVEQLAELHRIGVELTLQNGLEKTLSSIAESVNKIVKSAFCTIFPYYEATSRFGVGVRRGEFEDQPDEPRENGLSFEIVKNRASEFVTDANKHPKKNSQFLESRNLKSWASISLMYGERPVGVMHVNFSESHEFPYEEKELIQLVATQAAVAIENTTLYENLIIRIKQIEEQTKAWEAKQRNVTDAMMIAQRGQLGAQLVHKITNSIGTIPLRVNSIKKELNLNSSNSSTVFDHLDAIGEESRQLIKLARGFRQSESGVVGEGLDVNEVLKEAGNGILAKVPKTEKRIDVKYQFANDLPLMAIGKPILYHTFENIIQNAVDAIASGGEITLRTKRIFIEEQQFIEISISDTGSGIPDDILPHIFELDFSTKKVGSGFGLCRDKLMIETLNGTIQVHTVVGIGSTFIIRIPIGSSSGKV